jgi:hypothetical protein
MNTLPDPKLGVAILIALSLGRFLVGSPGAGQSQTGGIAGVVAVEVGGQQERGGTELYRVRDGLLLEDGRFVVAESDRILLFDADGQLDRVLAREGQGPGEVTRVASLSLGPAGDTVWVFDSMLRRVTALDLMGQSMVTYPLGYEVEIPPQNIPLPGGFVLAVGGRAGSRLRKTYLEHQGAVRPGEGVSLIRDTLDVSLVGGEGGSAIVSVMEDGDLLRITEGIMTVDVRPPGGRRLLFGMNVSGIALCHDDSPVVSVLDPKGAPVREIRVSRTPVRIVDEYLDSLKTEFLKPTEEVFPGVEPPDDSRRRALELAPEVEWRALFEEILLDRDGEVWLKEEARAGPLAGWIVIRRDGREEQLLLPAEMRVIDIGADRVMAVARDTLDVESVLIFEFPRTRDLPAP